MSQRVAATPAPPAGVLRDGDPVMAGGRVVQVPGRPARLCAPEARDDIGYEPGREPPPELCELGVDLEGPTCSRR